MGRVGRLLAMALMLTGALVAPSACANAAKEYEQGVTLEEFRRMGEKEVIALGNCQTNKVIEKVGQEKADAYFKDYVDYAVAKTREGEQIISAQEHMLKDGYTCTREEMERF
jgi:hypothetical protein